MRQTHTLMQDTLQSIHAHIGDEIEVMRGAVWITVGGEDIVIGRGQRHRLQVGGQAVIQALAPAQIIVRHDPSGFMPAWFTQWFGRVAAF